MILIHAEVTACNLLWKTCIARCFAPNVLIGRLPFIEIIKSLECLVSHICFKATAIKYHHVTFAGFKETQTFLREALDNAKWRFVAGNKIRCFTFVLLFCVEVLRTAEHYWLYSIRRCNNSYCYLALVSFYYKQSLIVIHSLANSYNSIIVCYTVQYLNKNNGTLIGSLLSVCLLWLFLRFN